MRVVEKNTFSNISTRIFVLTKEELTQNGLGIVVSQAGGFMTAGFKLFTEPSAQHTIFACSEFVEQLTEQEFMSILYHEEGHVVKGHVSLEADHSLAGTIINNVQLEIEADDYALTHVSEEDLLSAMVKLSKICGFKLNHPCMCPRVKAIMKRNCWGFVKRFKFIMANKLYS